MKPRRGDRNAAARSVSPFVEPGRVSERDVQPRRSPRARRPLLPAPALAIFHFSFGIWHLAFRRVQLPATSGQPPAIPRPASLATWHWTPSPVARRTLPPRFRRSPRSARNSARMSRSARMGRTPALPRRPDGRTAHGRTAGASRLRQRAARPRTRPAAKAFRPHRCRFTIEDAKLGHPRAPA